MSLIFTSLYNQIAKWYRLEMRRKNILSIYIFSKFRELEHINFAKRNFIGFTCKRGNPKNKFLLQVKAIQNVKQKSPFNNTRYFLSHIRSRKKTAIGIFFLSFLFFAPAGQVIYSHHLVTIDFNKTNLLRMFSAKHKSQTIFQPEFYIGPFHNRRLQNNVS